MTAAAPEIRRARIFSQDIITIKSIFISYY